MAATCRNGRLAGGGAGLAQAGEAETGRFAQAHQDQGLGCGPQAIEAERFPRLGLESSPLERLGQGLAQLSCQLLELGLVRPVFRPLEQAYGKAVALPVLKGCGQGVGDAAKLHGPAGVRGDRSQRR